MTTAAPPKVSPADVAVGYHQRTKHSLQKYAPGPETLDWDMQPNPFREFEGAPRTALPLSADKLGATLGQLYTRGAVAAAPVTLESVGALLQLSMGLTAWKQQGPDRWALRCNPSSGNLHPTEAYVVASGVAGLPDGLHHYVSRDHVLEQRRSDPPPTDGLPRLWLGLSSIHWREAWKYGERAFRYCQLDLGHAIGAVRYAAGALGWHAAILDEIPSAELAALLGLDRADDFPGAEKEDPDVLLALSPSPLTARPAPPAAPADGAWSGRANVLDRHPMYRWPVIDAVAQATRGGAMRADPPSTSFPALEHPSAVRAADVILTRRSAQRFDKRHTMPADAFFHMLDCLLPRAVAPWDAWGRAPRVHPVLFVHAVESLEPGVYVLPRRPEAEALLRANLLSQTQWRVLDEAPPHLPLRQMHAGDCRNVSRTLNCHQHIGSDACFAVAMLGELETTVMENPWRYRQLHWEAGLLGQVLYLEAEAAGLRGTGVGCYFDDELHKLLGLQGRTFQSMYGFTVGLPLHDDRIQTDPPYPGRS